LARRVDPSSRLPDLQRPAVVVASMVGAATTSPMGRSRCKTMVGAPPLRGQGLVHLRWWHSLSVYVSPTVLELLSGHRPTGLRRAGRTGRKRRLTTREATGGSSYVGWTVVFLQKQMT
jgi:hypothetical protein